MNNFWNGFEKQAKLNQTLLNSLKKEKGLVDGKLLDAKILMTRPITKDLPGYIRGEAKTITRRFANKPGGDIATENKNYKQYLESKRKMHELENPYTRGLTKFRYKPLKYKSEIPK